MGIAVNKHEITLDQAMILTESLTKELAGLAQQHPEVEVLWLYGSQAAGNAGPSSDIDLAAAFNPVKLDSVLDTRLRPELLALDWYRALGMGEEQLSVVDINHAPIPLAFSIINSNTVLWCGDYGRQLQEEARIMSMMEINFGALARG